MQQMINLTKVKTPFDEINIKYELVTNSDTLRINLNVLLNNINIGSISTNDSTIYPIKFYSVTPLMDSFIDDNIEKIKIRIEKNIEKLFSYLKAWK